MASEKYKFIKEVKRCSEKTIINDCITVLLVFLAISYVFSS